jgi:hypothetical protein
MKYEARRYKRQVKSRAGSGLSALPGRVGRMAQQFPMVFYPSYIKRKTSPGITAGFQVAHPGTWNGCDTFLAGLARLPDLEESLLSFEGEAKPR